MHLRSCLLTSLLAALLLAVAAGLAAASGNNYYVESPALTTATGRLTFASGALTNVCDVTLTATLADGAIPLDTLTRVGSVTSLRAANCSLPTTFLNIPTALGGRPIPGPDPSSWNLAFVSSNLVTEVSTIAVLDAQASMGFCLFRGAVAFTLADNGARALTAAANSIPSPTRCPNATVAGSLTLAPAVVAAAATFDADPSPVALQGNAGSVTVEFTANRPVTISRATLKTGNGGWTITQPDTCEKVFATGDRCRVEVTAAMPATVPNSVVLKNNVGRIRGGVRLEP